MQIKTALILGAGFFLVAAAISAQAKAETQSFEACVELANSNTEAIVACYNREITRHSSTIVKTTEEIKPLLLPAEATLLEETGRAYGMQISLACPLQGSAHVTREDLQAGIASPEAKLTTLDCQLKVLTGAVGDMTQLLTSLRDSRRP